MSRLIWSDSLKRVLCNNLRSVREQSKLSQAQTAFVLGITQSEYQRYECGKVKPSLSFFAFFCSCI